jgi:hypothetical protein
MNKRDCILLLAALPVAALSLAAQEKKPNLSGRAET